MALVLRIFDEFVNSW